MSGSPVTIRLVEHPSEAERRSVLDGLLAFNARYIPDENYTPVALLIESAAGEAQGGLVGAIYWNAFFVDLLWVAEDLRGSGVGRALMLQAEAYARSRRCAIMHLDTMSFQARGFYEKLGFSVFGTMTGYPHGIERYYLVKHLSDSDSPAEPPGR